MRFQIQGLDPRPFAPLFKLPDDQLSAMGAHRVRADMSDAYPCRVSLRRVEEGEELLLVNHVHQPVPTSPYRASGPIFVGRSSEPARFKDELPPMLRDRLVSLRAYDERAFIVDADVAEGGATEATLKRFLETPGVAVVDIHFARRGCFAARAVRSA